jgi:hypothetical protein
MHDDSAKVVPYFRYRRGGCVNISLSTAKAYHADELPGPLSFLHQMLISGRTPIESLLT